MNDALHRASSGWNKYTCRRLHCGLCPKCSDNFVGEIIDFTVQLLYFELLFVYRLYQLRK